MKKVLIANRGEIAVRVIRACHDLGMQTVAVYSQADAEALHVLLSDEAVCIGEAPSDKSYLKIPNILSACEITGSDAIHPGYGFLSENANFASICESCGIEFIGPSAESVAALGDKAQAKSTAKKVRCPIISGSDGIVHDYKEALNVAKEIGYPIFIKAVAGGGGRGIRIAYSEDDLEKGFSMARAEAEVCFGNPEVYLEKMIMNPRHVEVQIIGDKYGNYVHLGERDCSIQRRRQKLIEETPSPIITPKLRKVMGQAAINIAKAANYHSLGTVEFLIDKKGCFYFMEMNTRAQVEHTITEELTGVDLIVEQIRIARGEKLRLSQRHIDFDGHVIEFRINAEDPSNNFIPFPGVLKHFISPGGPNVRVDTACYSGYKIPKYYDSMIAKLIVKGKTREEAIAVGRRALREFHIVGVPSTIPFHKQILEDEIFLKGTDYDLHYVDIMLGNI